VAVVSDVMLLSVVAALDSDVAALAAELAALASDTAAAFLNFKASAV
jgi:hypothetical protein